MPRVSEWQVARVALIKIRAVPIPCITMPPGHSLELAAQLADLGSFRHNGPLAARFAGLLHAVPERGFIGLSLTSDTTDLPARLLDHGNSLGLEFISELMTRRLRR